VKPAKTREEWLTRVAQAIEPLIDAAATECGLPLGPEWNYRVSCSWPGGRANRNKAIGQCWNRAASKGKVNEIFLSPTIDDPAKAADVITHELVHAWDDCRSGHRGTFAKLARAVGLEGKLTATTAGEALSARLAGIVDRAGPYPHAGLKASAASKAKQTTRMVKIGCQCGVIGRMSRAQIDASTWRCDDCGELVLPTEE